MPAALPRGVTACAEESLPVIKLRSVAGLVSRPEYVDAVPGGATTPADREVGADGVPGLAAVSAVPHSWQKRAVGAAGA